MRWDTAIAALIWVVFLVSPFFQVPPEQVAQFPPLPLAVLLLPFVVVGLGIVITNRPSTYEPVHGWVDRRFGDGTFVRFLRKLQPTLLIAATLVVFGISWIVRSYRPNTTIEDYTPHLLFVSAGIAFLLLRFVLARRGLLLESHAYTGEASRDLLPAGLRNLRATRKTAFLAGAWLVFGTSIGGLLGLDSLTGLAAGLAVAIFVIFFFFIPLFLFVLGIQQDELRKGSFSRETFTAMLAASGRGLFWLFGAIAFRSAWPSSVT